MSKSRGEIRDEMTGLLLRGGLIGLVAFAVAIGFMVVPRLIGQIWPVSFTQTGYRGTGMAVVQYESDAVEIAARNVLPETPAPILPEAGEPLAGDVYPYAGELGNLTVRNFDRLNDAIGLWVGPEAMLGPENTWRQQISLQHIAMTRALNDDWDIHNEPAGVNCYTCHRGNLVPENVWFLPTPLNSWAGPSAMFQNQATDVNYSTALPVDAMRTYLLESDQAVGVHGTSARNPGEPGASIYHTYQTFSLMQHFSNSMGVNCTYCHNTRALAEIEQATPQWAVAQLGRAMTQDVNNSYIVSNAELLPPEQLGPLGDAAKVNCTTCHQGAPKTFGGASAIENWPELVSDEPLYE